MTHWTRSWPVAAAAVFALAAVPGAIITIHAPGIANADVCLSGGRRVSVSGCANIADAVAPYVPPPAYYVPMPYDPPRPRTSAGVSATKAGGSTPPAAIRPLPIASRITWAGRRVSSLVGRTGDAVPLQRKGGTDCRSCPDASSPRQTK